MSEEVPTLPSASFLILAFLAGSAFSIFIIYLITWVSDRLKESGVRFPGHSDEEEASSIGEVDTERLLDILRRIRKDNKTIQSKESGDSSNHAGKKAKEGE